MPLGYTLSDDSPPAPQGHAFRDAKKCVSTLEPDVYITTMENKDGEEIPFIYESNQSWMYCIHQELSDHEIRDIYKGLWEIEESFKIW